MATPSPTYQRHGDSVRGEGAPLLLEGVSPRSTGHDDNDNDVIVIGSGFGGLRPTEEYPCRSVHLTNRSPGPSPGRRVGGKIGGRMGSRVAAPVSTVLLGRAHECSVL